MVENLPANAKDPRDVGLIPGSGRFPGEGNSNPLQYSCLENSMERRARWTTVHGVTKSWTQLSTLFLKSRSEGSLRAFPVIPLVPKHSAHAVRSHTGFKTEPAAMGSVSVEGTMANEILEGGDWWGGGVLPWWCSGKESACQ